MAARRALASASNAGARSPPSLTPSHLVLRRLGERVDLLLVVRRVRLKHHEPADGHGTDREGRHVS